VRRVVTAPCDGVEYHAALSDLKGALDALSVADYTISAAHKGAFGSVLICAVELAYFSDTDRDDELRAVIELILSSTVQR